MCPCPQPIPARPAKISKYRKVAEAESAFFVPFVLETFGGFGTQALKFVSDVTSLAKENLSLGQAESDFRGSMVRCLAIALQKGNAHVALSGALSSREYAGRSIGIHKLACVCLCVIA